MPQVDPNLIWIEEASEVYQRSRPWLREQVDTGKLHTATIAGDRKVYLLRSELDALLKPRINYGPSEQVG